MGIDEKIGLEEVERRERLVIVKIIKVMKSHKGMALGKNYIIDKIYRRGTHYRREFDELIKSRYFREVLYKGDTYYALNEISPQDYLIWDEWRD